jgi:hypothetical protein
MKVETRYGRDYFMCESCPYGTFQEDTTRAHERDHEPRPTLEERLRGPASVADDEAPHSVVKRSKKES